MTTAPPPVVTAQDLRSVELFADLSPDQHAWLLQAGRIRSLQDGEVLFRDGEPARWFCVLVRGGLAITKTVDGREEVLTRHSVGGDAPEAPGGGNKPSAAHGFTGEMPLLVEGDYVATATAQGPTVVLAYHRDAFLEMLVRCPQVAKILVPVLAWRIHSSEVQAAQRTRLDALGTLAAGLAHELNNPAAAVARATTDLSAALPELEKRAQEWGAVAGEEERARLAAARAEVLGLPTGVGDALTLADTEDDLADWLQDHGLEDADSLAGVLAERGLGPDWLDGLVAGMDEGTLRPAVAYLDAATGAAVLSAEASEAGARVSDIIASVKDYTNLDRAPEQEVDLVQGLESTLAVLRGRLAGVAVERSYAPGVPLVCGYPTELNQVWTNLVDNAVDAMADAARDQGRTPLLRVSAAADGTCAIVRVTDNGAGIPDEVLPHLFDPFFTTKDVGRGTGLGLHLSHRIVTRRHGGSISVATGPQGTEFSVRLPSRRGGGDPA